MMIRRDLSLALVLVITSVASAAAQTAAGRCDDSEAAGFLGISGIDCNCTIGSRDPERWAFRTEPRITSLELNTRAGKILRIGDVITHVNGQLITSRQGAQTFARVRPGEVVVLTIRRNGQSLRYALTADAACPGDARLGMYAPGSPARAPRTAAAAAGQAARTLVAPARAPAPPQVRRGSFGFGLMCKGNCAIRTEPDGALSFSHAPEVYSVERGSGADRAGIRRGDVITHVNGRSITSKEGGAIFGKARPGATLRFTVQRGGSSRTVALRSTPAAAPVAELTKSSESLLRAQNSLRELQKDQQQHLERIEDELKRSRSAEAAHGRELQRELYRKEQEHRRRLAELSQELAHAEARLQAALADSTRGSCAVAQPRAGSRTMRYTGLLGDTEIEVHGSSPVWVSETDHEVTITAGQTQIKVRKNRK